MLKVSCLTNASASPVSFDLARGEILAVQGASGAGKSLMLRAIADLDPAQGDVFLEGRARAEFSGPQWRQLVGYVPAEPGWWAEDIGQHFSAPQAVIALMGKLDLDPAILEKPVIQASTGERARLALVRALSRNPRVLLLDEPTSALDHARTLAVEALIADLAASGLSVVWVTHDSAQAKRISNRCLIVTARNGSTGQAAS